MAVTLNASASSGLIQTADTSTVLQLQTNGTTALTVDTTANVGIGTSSPGSILDVQSTTSIIRNTATTGTNQVAIRQGNTGGYFYTGIDTSAGGYLTGAAYAGFHWMSGAYPMIFATNNSERLRIDSSGNLLVGTTSASTPSTTGFISTANTFGFKNRIINGAMVIDQRNAGASVTPTVGAYTVDRWKLGINVASKLTAQQTPNATETGYATRVNAGFTNYLAITTASAYSATSTDYFEILQNIEGFNVADLGWGTANAKTITLSFWAYSSLTGTFSGAVQNSAGNRSYPFTFTIGSANTWTQISVTIAGDTTGTWLTTNGIGICVQFDLGSGTTYRGTAGAWAGANYIGATGAVSVVANAGATFYITGVQLEKGSTATSFDYRPYGTELQLCQRYFNVQSVMPVVISSATTVAMIVKFAMEMRASPSANYVTGLYVWNPAGANQPLNSINAISATDNSTSGCRLVGTPTSLASVTAGMMGYVYQNVSGTGGVQFSAEL